MDICVVTNDAVVARFIELELREAGYIAEKADDFKEGAKLYICDLDYFSDGVPHGIIGFSYDEGKQKNVQTFLRRPIDTVKLRDAVSKKLASAYVKSDRTFLEIDKASRMVRTTEGEVRLSKKELLLMLMLYEKELVTREDGIEIFGEGESNVVDVYIHYLRKKLVLVCDTDPIKSKRGEGYYLSDSFVIKFA